MAEDLRLRYAKAIANAECEQRPRCVICMTAAVMAVRDEELEQLREERDQAIAHDRQPYPTQWAYDQACKALDSWRERAETTERRLARVRDLHQPTEGMGFDCDEDDTPGSYGRIAQVCTSCGTPGEQGVRWPCPTLAALDAPQEA